MEWDLFCILCIFLSVQGDQMVDCSQSISYAMYFLSSQVHTVRNERAQLLTWDNYWSRRVVSTMIEVTR